MLFAGSRCSSRRPRRLLPIQDAPANRQEVTSQASTGTTNHSAARPKRGEAARRIAEVREAPACRPGNAIWIGTGDTDGRRQDDGRDGEVDQNTPERQVTSGDPPKNGRAVVSPRVGRHPREEFTIEQSNRPKPNGKYRFTCSCARASRAHLRSRPTRKPDMDG